MQLGMQLRLVQYNNMLIEVRKLQNDSGTAPVNWLLDKNKAWRLVSNPSCDGKEPPRLLVPRFNDVRAFKFPSVVGSVPERPTFARASPTTRWVFPTKPQVTPVNAGLGESDLVSTVIGQGLIRRTELEGQTQFPK